MIKIVFIVEDIEVGGTERMLLQWVKNCDRNNFEPLILTFRDGKLKNELDSLNIKTWLIKKKRPFDLIFLLRLIKILKRMNPDVVHCRNGIPVISYGVLASKICKIPVISSIHGKTHYLKRNFKTMVWFWVIRKSNVIIAVSESIKNDISKLGNIDSAKIKVIYNGIDLNEVISSNSKIISRKDYGLTDTDFVIGTVGNLRKVKGHYYLINAMVSILSNAPNAKLVLIGDGEEKGNLEKLAKDLNIEDKVKFLGYKDNAKELISIFDVFVLPSLSEGFPNVLLEAAVTKKPIVATRVGGIEELVKNGYSALLVEKSNSEAIAERVLEIKNNPVLANTLVGNAYNDIVEKFNINRFMKEFEKNYISISKVRSF